MNKSRGGVDRKDLSVSSAGNHIELFASSDAFFASVFRDMEDTSGSDDSIWITGWSLDIDIPLLPLDEDYEKSTLRRVLERAVVKRDVQVRILLWQNLFDRKRVVAARDFINNLGVQAAAKGFAVLVFDDRLPHKLSSHHQKAIVIHKKNELIAYVGHRELRAERGIKKDKIIDGWIDGSARLHGAAAEDVAANFVGRWNSSNRPCGGLEDELLEFQNPSMAKFNPIHEYPHLAIPTDGTTTVQVVRTFSPLYKENGGYQEFAPQGELSLLEARVKAIQQAKNFIYIEDQYFFEMPRLMKALREVLPHIQRVIVFVQRPTVTTNAKVAGYERLVFAGAKPLLDEFPSKFQIYTTDLSWGLYVHAKIVIVDDVYLSIGSANWNRRSMTSDSEMAISVIDSEHQECPQDKITVGRLVRGYRLRRIQEKTNVPLETLEKMSLVESLDILGASASDPKSLVDILHVESKWEFVLFASPHTREAVDPDDVEDNTS
ncbi:TPA: hypothetical protein N0F65_010099 [Lagenidium giganteum]|uniref:phospholipase D n=1 Tax=Lagenidium giganteum TaxID=4803 RepID=A0AAV2YIE4_9STRA|nr:TPA: hypothetical protein N0F65_010099 [Lagenidium giganteum]